MKIKIRLLFIFLLLFIYQCSNPYLESFVGIHRDSTRFKHRHRIEKLRENQQIKFYTTDNMDKTVQRLFENGYIYLGNSKFNSEKVKRQKAIIAAEKIGATVIVVKSKYLGSITETVPYETKQPDRTHTIKKRKYNDTGLISYKEKIITIEGEYKTTYNQFTRDYYDYHATFWGKLKNPKLGLFVSDLTSELKKKMQTNRGVIVKVIIKGSPAFIADILKDDILISINNERINERRHFFKLLSKNIGKEIILKGFRNNKKFNIKIKLNN